MDAIDDFAMPLGIPEVILLKPRRFSDGRGFFSETFQVKRYAAAGIGASFVQDNHSYSVAAGTVRGLHLQLPPAAQGKLVRVVRGAIWDVAVDIRVGSATFGRHVASELSAENWHQIWIPPGFLHGYCTLTPDTEVVYKTTALYERDLERGVVWNDPELAIPWPVDPQKAVVSEKDCALPVLASCPGWFSAGV